MLVVLRGCSLAAGLAALGFTGYQIYRMFATFIPHVRWIWSFVDNVVYLWLDVPILLALRLPEMGMSPMQIAYLVIHAAAIAMSIVLAKRLKRSILDWTLFAVPFPYLSLLILAFQQEQLVPSKSSVVRCIKAIYARDADMDERTVRILRALSLATGLWALAQLGFGIYSGRALGSILGWGEAFFLYWPRRVSTFLSMLEMGLPLSYLWRLYIHQLLFYVWMVGLSLVMASALNHSRLDWGILAVPCPYLSTTILAFLKRRATPAKGVIGKVSEGAQSAIVKRCSRCHKRVPASSRAGQRCPHCGAYWSAERTTYK